MKKIHLIMPMGGGGTRFGNKGFDVPKPIIGLQGKPFFYWASKSVEKVVDNVEKSPIFGSITGFRNFFTASFAVDIMLYLV